MSLQSTPTAERVRIGFFGRRNAGKSSLINAIAAQELSIVSPIAGTTTDTVKKAMELLPAGPVLLLDTPGLDDEGELGVLRVRQAKKALFDVDLAVVVLDATVGLGALEEALLSDLAARGVPHLIAENKCDLTPARTEGAYALSAKTKAGVESFKTALAEAAARCGARERDLLDGLCEQTDLVLLVCPIDASAPKGRLILPQQQTVRALLDRHATALVCQPGEVSEVLARLAVPPRLVITDSQVFSEVARAVPQDVALTSFSILFARYKGELDPLLAGVAALAALRPGARVLISEGCTHHRQCGDIGTVKLPRAIEKKLGFRPDFAFTSGGDFPDTPADTDLVIHCGACMLTQAQMHARMARAAEAGVPMTNYGMALAYLSGILPRAVAPFGITL